MARSYGLLFLAIVATAAGFYSAPAASQLPHRSPASSSSRPAVAAIKLSEEADRLRAARKAQREAEELAAEAAAAEEARIAAEAEVAAAEEARIKAEEEAAAAAGDAPKKEEEEEEEEDLLSTPAFLKQKLKVLEKEMAEVKEKTEAAKAEAETIGAEWTDKRLRLQTDFDNFKARHVNQTLEAQVEARIKLLQDFLPVRVYARGCERHAQFSAS